MAWAALALLGAVHGLNPGMGWLFAVARGLQERDRRAVWGALLPLAAGHALAIAAAIAVAAVLGLALPADGLRWMVAATLLIFGLLRLRRHRHPRGMGMRVGAGDLTLWSFLMASAHGAIPSWTSLAANRTTVAIIGPNDFSPPTASTGIAGKTFLDGRDDLPKTRDNNSRGCRRIGPGTSRG